MIGKAVGKVLDQSSLRIRPLLKATDFPIRTYRGECFLRRSTGLAQIYETDSSALASTTCALAHHIHSAISRKSHSAITVQWLWKNILVLPQPLSFVTYRRKVAAL